VGEGTGVYRVLVGKPEEKRQLGRPRRRWVDNIKMDLMWLYYYEISVRMCVCIQGVSGGIVNILGGGSMDYSE